MRSDFPNKKKIRGWKRRIREIEKWEKCHHSLDLAAVSRHGRYHIRFYVAPWYNLTKRSPPFKTDQKESTFPSAFYRLPELENFQWGSFLHDDILDKEDIEVAGWEINALLEKGWEKLVDSDLLVKAKR